MIVYEQYNETLTRAISDAGMLIERDGVQYEEAIDPTELKREYTETDIPIDHGEETSDDATLSDYKEALALLGIDEEGKNT